MRSHFHLTRYFVATSLVAFAAVTATLIHFENRQADYFQQVQANDARLLSDIQSKFLQRADAVARQNLLTVHEQGNVNLTRLFSSALWTSDFTPYLQQAGAVDFSSCFALPDEAGADKNACFKAAGARLQQLDTFGPLDARVRAAMQGSTVAKIKVFNLAGVTMYSTEHAQMGEDKSKSPGWVAAARQGQPLSELSFRDKFQAIQGQVENSDLISSYLPVIEPGTQRIVGVFEVYSDVTPFVRRIKDSSSEFRQVADANQTHLAERSAINQVEVKGSSTRQVAIVAVMLALLYLVLLSIVRRAQTVIDRQARESEATRQRLAQSEKMTSLGQMVAGVAHQLNTPLAFSKNNVLMSIQALDQLEHAVNGQLRTAVAQPDRAHPASQDELSAAVAELGEAREMLNDVLMGMGQMNELVDNLRSFTRLDRAPTAHVNLNSALGSVCYIAKSVISTKVKLDQVYQPLPAIECNVSQLNQVFLNLINNAAQAIADAGTVTVFTTADSTHITVSIRDTGAGIAPDVLPHIFDAYFTTKPEGEGTGLGLAIARTIVQEHGGDIEVSSQIGVGSEFRVKLPVQKAAEA